jgi:F-type H+-transporting ATPase subunit delta
MNEGLISRRYAKALYFHASERGEETLLYHRMKTLESLLSSVPALRTHLKSPLIPTKEKLKLLRDATGENPESSYVNFIALVFAHRREEALRLMALGYQTFYRQQKKISVVHLTSARELSDEALERIRRLAEQQTHGAVEFSTRVDPSLDGGFVFQLNDFRMDASVKGQLQRIGQRLSQMNRSIL